MCYSNKSTLYIRTRQFDILIYAIMGDFKGGRLHPPSPLRRKIAVNYVITRSKLAQSF